jgi:molecular chaperone GrpE
MSQRDESNGSDEPGGTGEAEGNGEAEANGNGEATGNAAAEPTEADVVEPVLLEPEPTDEERLRAQLEEAAARLRTVSKAYTDLQQEMDAFRKRQQILAESKAEKKAAQVVERFFEPLQNLRRALDQEGATADDLRNGVSMVVQQFNKRMEELGLTEVPGMGALFDPNVHDALAVMPVTDPAQDGRVVAVHTNGWAVGDRVIQPAQVVIGKFQEPAEA